MKKISLFVGITAISFASNAQKSYNYNIVEKSFPVVYLKHKEYVNTPNAKFISGTGIGVNGDTLKISDGILGIKFQSCFDYKHLIENKKKGQYKATFQFLEIKQEEKVVAKENINGLDRYFYSVPFKSKLRLTILDEKGNLAFDTLIGTTAIEKYPEPSASTFYDALSLRNGNVKVETRSEVGCVYALWTNISKTSVKLTTPFFGDEKLTETIPWFKVGTKDPLLKDLKPLEKKFAMLIKQTIKGSKADVATNWHNTDAAKTASELLPLISEYLDPKYSAGITDPKDKMSFERSMLFNVFIVQLFSSEFIAANTTLTKIKEKATKEGSKSPSMKNVNDAIEKWEPILKHEMKNYETHKIAFNYVH